MNSEKGFKKLHTVCSRPGMHEFLVVKKFEGSVLRGTQRRGRIYVGVYETALWRFKKKHTVQLHLRNGKSIKCLLR